MNRSYEMNLNLDSMIIEDDLYQLENRKSFKKKDRMINKYLDSWVCLVVVVCLLMLV